MCVTGYSSIKTELHSTQSASSKPPLPLSQQLPLLTWTCTLHTTPHLSGLSPYPPAPAFRSAFSPVLSGISLFFPLQWSMQLKHRGNVTPWSPVEKETGLVQSKAPENKSELKCLWDVVIETSTDPKGCGSALEFVECCLNIKLSHTHTLEEVDSVKVGCGIRSMFF